VGQYQQYHYIAGNEYPTKSKEKLDFANDESTYSQTHKKYHEKFRDYLSAFGYYDVFLWMRKVATLFTASLKKLIMPAT
jgi:hypothetical protein